MIGTIALKNRGSSITIQPVESKTLLVIEGNSLLPISPPTAPSKPIVSANLTENSNSNSIEKEKLFLISIIDSTLGLSSDEILQLLRICFCESSFNEKAVSYAGWRSGMGLCGFIPSTWNGVLKELNKFEKEERFLPQRCYQKFVDYDESHPIFDKECNFLMAAWLYKTEGDGPWASSQACWQNFKFF